MRFFEPNEKRTTVSVYVFLVGLFTIFCVMVGLNFDLVLKFIGGFFEIIRPIIYGFIIAFALYPAVRFIEKTAFKRFRCGKKLKHTLSVLIVYLLLIMLLLMFFLVSIPEVIANIDDLQIKVNEFVEGFQNTTVDILTPGKANVIVYFDVSEYNRLDPSDDLFSFTLRNMSGMQLNAKSQSMTEDVKELFDKIVNSIGDMLSNSIPVIFTSAMEVLNETKNIVIGVIISLYFILGEKKHRQFLSTLGSVWIPKKPYRILLWFIEKTKNIFRDYIVVRLLDCMIMGALSFVCLFVFQTPFAMLLSMILGVASFFPFIGPIIGIMIGSLIVLIIDVRYMLVFLIVAVLLNIIDLRYIEPMLNAGKHLSSLSAIWVFTAIILMGGFFGAVGVVIGIPLFAFFYSLLKEKAEVRLQNAGLATETSEWYVSKTIGGAQAIDNPDEDTDVLEGTDMESFFAERDDARAYRNLKFRIRIFWRKTRFVRRKIVDVFIKIYVFILPALKLIWKCIKKVCAFTAKVFKKVINAFKKLFQGIKKAFKKNKKTE